MAWGPGDWKRSIGIFFVIFAIFFGRAKFLALKIQIFWLQWIGSLKFKFLICNTPSSAWETCPATPICPLKLALKFAVFACLRLYKLGLCTNRAYVQIGLMYKSVTKGFPYLYISRFQTWHQSEPCWALVSCLELPSMDDSGWTYWDMDESGGKAKRS